tara:strand:+ start:2634 stop:3416 length:783 start_codon:yes stop_codon:yes gene_type:complete
LLIRLKPDGVLFVGDLGEGEISVVRALKKLPFPVAVILGNHDHGHDKSGRILKAQLNLLGELDYSWKFKEWTNPCLSLLGARPCSPGGGFFISKEVQAVFGPVSLLQSVDRMVNASKFVSEKLPFIILAHSGPTGLGSEAASPCGRDWKSPAIDWGDQDLSLAIDQIRKIRVPDLVVFGHTHHFLKRGKGKRRTFIRDLWGTAYLNAACVPRKGKSSTGEELCHFSWVKFENNKLVHLSHRWYREDFSLAFKEDLLDEKI